MGRKQVLPAVELNENWICVGIITTLQSADIIVLNDSQRTRTATSVQYALRNTAQSLLNCNQFFYVRDAAVGFKIQLLLDHMETESSN